MPSLTPVMVPEDVTLPPWLSQMPMLLPVIVPEKIIDGGGAALDIDAVVVGAGDGGGVGHGAARVQVNAVVAAHDDAVIDHLAETGEKDDAVGTAVDEAAGFIDHGVGLARHAPKDDGGVAGAGDRAGVVDIDESRGYERFADLDAGIAPECFRNWN